MIILVALTTYVSIPGPTEDIPVKVTGNVKNGFNAEFVPVEVGIHMILVSLYSDSRCEHSSKICCSKKLE